MTIMKKKTREIWVLSVFIVILPIWAGLWYVFTHRSTSPTDNISTISTSTSQNSPDTEDTTNVLNSTSAPATSSNKISDKEMQDTLKSIQALNKESASIIQTLNSEPN